MKYATKSAIGTLLALGMLALSASAAVVTFTPSGGNSVSTSTDLYWNMLSNEVSTSPISGAPGNFYLSGHGDIHFNIGVNSIATAPAGGTGGETIPLGGMIDASLTWGTDGFAGTDDYGGTLTAGNTGIFGVRFDIAGETHYGWVEITEGFSEQSINSWGYETTPNTGILAGASAVPEPSGFLLLGASAALFGMRRTRRK